MPDTERNSGLCQKFSLAFFLFMLFVPLCAQAQALPGMVTPLPQEMIAGMHVASMKMGGATFWLRYTKTPDSLISQAEALESEKSMGDGPSEVQAWLKLIRAADGGRKAGKRLGDLELTVEGDAASGAQAIKSAAEEGKPDYQYMLAHLYYHGIGIAQDYKQAYFWMLTTQQGGAMSSPWISRFGPGDLKKISDKLTPREMAAQTKRYMEPSSGNVPGVVPGSVEDPPGGPSDLPGGPPDGPAGPPDTSGGPPGMGMEGGLVMYPPPYLP